MASTFPANAFPSVSILYDLLLLYKPITESTTISFGWQAPTMTEVEDYFHYVGSKTNARILNRAWTLAYASHQDANQRYRTLQQPLEKDVTLISSR